MWVFELWVIRGSTVVATDERDRGSLRDEQNVPARGKSHETYRENIKLAFFFFSRARFKRRVPMIPKKILGLPSPPEALLPSSSILSMAVICLPVYTASSSITTSSSCAVRSIL